MLRSRFALVLVPLSMLCLAGWQTPTEGKLDAPALKTMLGGLGYEVTEPGTGTFEVAMKTSDFNIPTRVFLAKSGTKVWLSVALMQKDAVDKLTRDDLMKILQTNVDVGPCHFMVDGGWLKMKMALDNRGLTPAVMRSELNYLAARIADSKGVWQK